MGGGGKGGTTTTQTMQIPPEVMARYNAVNARAETVAQTPYQPYSSNPNAFVAPLTQTQQAGIQNTNTMAGAAQPYYGAAAALTAAGAGSANPQGLNVGQYYNPYTQAVADPTLRALQQQQGVEQSSLMNPQSARSFGGDRSGLVQANLTRQQDLATAQAMSPIYKQAYDQALATAQQQQGVGLAAQQANLQRLGQAGAQFGQLGSSAQAAGLAGAQAQLAAGQTEQQTSQAGLQALYNQFQQQQAYPFQIAQFLSNIATGTGALSGNTTTSNTQGGGGFFSDERLKENIEQVGKTNDGQNIYRYNYKGDPRSQIGLIAQEVAQDHPEAVGQKDGYLTVDYRDATNDAVRDHKAGGGSTDLGTSSYDMDAPSAMMGSSPVSPEVLAGLVAKPMGGLGGLPITTGASDPGAAGLLAPKATGVSPGSIESAQAQLATLRGADMGKSQSGQAYFDQQKGQLQDFLSANGADPGPSQSSYNGRPGSVKDFFAANGQRLWDDFASHLGPHANTASSQGGLVSVPGEYARGGYAGDGYVNPALQFYGTQGHAGLGAGGPYGAQLTPAQVQMMRAAELRTPQQKSGLEQANQIANLTAKGYDAWKARPKWMGNDPDAGSGKGDPVVKPGGTTNASSGLAGGDASVTGGAKAPAGDDAATGAKSTLRVSDLGSDDQFVARGGLIHREHHAGGLGVGTPYGSISEENALSDALTAPAQKHEMMQPGKMGNPTPPPTGAQQVGQVAGLGLKAKSVADMGKSAYDFAAKKLAGDTTGAAGQTVNTGSATGYSGLGAGEATATPLAEATTGAASTVAPGVEAGISAVAPATQGLAAVAAPAAEAATGLSSAAPLFASGLDAAGMAGGLAGATEGAGLIGGAATGAGAAGASLMDLLPFIFLQQGGRVDEHRQHHAFGERVKDVDENGNPIPPANIPDQPPPREEPSRLASFASDVGDFASGLGKKVADADSNFWVPAIAGIGSMLASPQKTLAGAIGEGLVGGTGAYTTMQKQQADQMKQRFDIAKSTFRGPVMNSNGDWTWEDTRTGEMVLQPEYQRRYHALVGGSDIPGSTHTQANTSDVAPPPVRRGPPTIVDAAKETTSGPPPRLEPRAVPKPAPKPVPEAEPEPGAAPNVEKPVAQVIDEKTFQQMRIEAFENPKNWEGFDPSTDPHVLLPQVAVLNDRIKQLEQEAENANALATKAAERNPDQGKIYQTKATNLMTQAERLRKERDDKVVAAQKAIDGAVQFAVEKRKAQITEGVKRDFAPQITPGGETVLLPPGQKMPVATAPAPTAEQAAAPKVADVDAKTGQLVLARPAAPAGGGLIQPNLPPGTKVTEISATAKNQNAMDEQFQKDFVEKAPSVAQARQRYVGLTNAFKLFESGSTESTRAGWAAVAQTFGYPEIASKIASGDPAGVQWVEKIGPNLVLETLKAATPRFAQSEFNTLQTKGTPEPNKLPQANFQMVKEGMAMLNRTDAFMQAWQRASQEEGWRSPSAYYMAWSKANPIDKFEKAAERQMGNFAGMPLPPSSEWTPGAIYVVPNNLSGSQSAFFRSRGMKAGDTFQYGGRDAAPDLVIKPIPKQQLYSTPAMGQ